MRPLGHNMVSIVDVARHCGVTPSSVSRALNNKAGVSESLRQKIKQACIELNYAPNEVARTLITKESKLIGLIIPDLVSTYYASIAKGVNEYLRSQGYNVLLCDCNRDEHIEKDNIQFLKRQRVEGIIMVSVTASESDIKAIKDSGIQVVAADVELSESISSVINDNYTGALQLFRHMIHQGCKNIGLILGNKRSKTTIDRLRAFKQVMEENAIEFNEHNIIYTDATFENGYKKTKGLLGKGIDSIFAINDSVALGAIKYCQDHGIKIPDDIKVAGYDDLEISSMISVPLTTVHQRKIFLGKKAAELLLQEIENAQDPIKIVLTPRLVVRASLGEKQ